MAINNENSFENLTFNPFSNQENILLNNNFDPDENFFDKNSFSKINAQYFSVDETNIKLSTCCDKNSLSILHVNIRSMSKNFEKLKLMLNECNYNFSIICLTETWCSDESFRNDSTLHLLSIILFI